MKCPRTGEELKEIEVCGVMVDISEACGGVWFDNFELSRFDEAHKSAGDELMKIMDQYRNDDIDLKEKIKCPRCTDVVLHRHYFSVKRTVEIDECPECGGVWLDPGELANIRAEYKTEKERNAEGAKFVDDIYAESELKKELEKHRIEKKQSSFFDKIFKFLRPKALRDEEEEEF